MSPFFFGKKKKNKEPEEPQERSWEIYEATYDDAPLLIRSNAAYLDFKDKQKFGHHAGVAISLNTPNPGGLPDTDETDELFETETGIETYLCQDGDTMLVTTLTTGTTRELVFYTAEPDTCEKRLDILAQQVQSHRIQVMIEPDENWETYYNFIP